MASFNTGVHPSEVMGETDKSLHVVVKNKDGVPAPYHLSKRMGEWKYEEGYGKEPVYFVQTWYAKQIGLAS